LRMFVKIIKEKCTGCKLCQLACSMEKREVFWPEKALIKVNVDSKYAESVPAVCRQCKNPPCIIACKYDALYKDEETGRTLLDVEKCTGCRACVTACPFNGIYMDEDANKAMKCDVCNGEPKCVSWCYPGALILQTS